jgi:myo-inositol-1(or 4)-monophosphatase
VNEERTAAIRACERAAAHSADAFRDGRPAGEYDGVDAKTDLDARCEETIVSTLRDAFPDDRVLAEERGAVGPDADREWIVDPLDGTNNLAAGIPMFAHAVCLRDGDGALLTVVYEPLTDDLYVAERGTGATVNGDPVTAGTDVPLSAGTVSLVPGLDAVRNHQEQLARVEAGLDNACKRVLSTWAPCIDWGLLARGTTEAVVTVSPDVWEQPAGSLLAREAGARTHEDGTDRVGVYAADATVRDGVLDALP